MANDISATRMIAAVFMLLTAFYILCPKLNNATYLGFGILIALLFALFAKNPNILKNTKLRLRHALYILLIFYVLVIGSISGGVSSGISQAGSLALWLFPLFLFELAMCFEKKQIRVITFLSIAFVVYCVIITWFYLSENPYFARDMANYHTLDSYHSSAFFLTGGGYSLLFGLIPIAAMLGLLCRRLRGVNKIIAVVGSVVLFVFISAANLATPLLLAVAAFTLSLLFCGRANSRRWNTLVAMLVILVVLLVMTFELHIRIGEAILSLMPNDSIVSLRIGSALGISGFGDDGDTLSDRLIRMQKSAEYVVTNPIMGAGFLHGFDYPALSNYLGQHTEWLDFAGVFGIPMSILYIMVVYLSYKNIANHLCNPTYKSLMAIVVFFVAVAGLFDPIRTTSLYTVAFFVIPSLCLIFEREHERRRSDGERLVYFDDFNS